MHLTGQTVVKELHFPCPSAKAKKKKRPKQTEGVEVTEKKVNLTREWQDGFLLAHARAARYAAPPHPRYVHEGHHRKLQVAHPVGCR